MEPSESRRSRSRGPAGRLAAAAGLALAAAFAVLAAPAAAAADIPVPETILVGAGEVYDGRGDRYYGTGDLGDGGQNEGQDPIFRLEAGATLTNVVIGHPGADGVHCYGSCTLRDVVWQDVGEDAATFRANGSSATFTVQGGSAARADDKIFQHNGPGTLTVTNFSATDFGALYRSCGNCGTQHQRHVVFDGVTLTAPGDRLAGINENYGDTATFRNITINGDDERDITICQRYIGNDEGDEPEESGEGPDGQHCRYSESDITYR
ncbi:pectate lyase [Allonocardiopsis opalescens]|uniref:Pectate lyase n=1 Tax=Allonocardiopsis opalescens TaxID=1144618 RepID=A0A2T0PXI8_9ACTN|nr:pectate lyase [Allonocardiopsis opalescens]PRX96116.1 pectate lyase-like protein [Allonocardiopsis opalescens]